MKKFVIISLVLIILAGSVFGVSLYHYIDVTKDTATKDEATVVATEKPTEAQDETVSVASNIPMDWQDNGIFSKNYDKAYEYVQNMSAEQKVGQLILGVCPTDETAEACVTRYGLGGYVYTSDCFSGMSVEDVRLLISKYQTASKTPMIMAVTEEGGAKTTVSDLDAFSNYDFYSPRETFLSGSMDAIKTAEQQKANMLSSIGANLNLAPVCDMATEQNHIMYSRSLGGTLSDVQQYAQNVTAISQAQGVSVALKHFPGYGTTEDTVESIVTDSRDISVFESEDLKPFESGINAGAHFVVVSNAVVTAFDPTHTASLSANVHKVLRETLKFTGLAITDNLNNADYSAYSDGKDVAVTAVLAGNDMIMVTDFESAYMSLLGAVNDGTISDDVLDRCCTRVIAYKYTVGLMKD